MRAKQAVTVYDIALTAGVSPATVSRVLRGSSPVAAQKRQAVLAAAETLRYRPNPLAQDLASGYSKTIGLLLPDTVSSFWGPLVKGVEAALREHDYHLLIASAEACATETRAVDLLIGHRVGGLVIAGAAAEEAELRRALGDVPNVAVGCRSAFEDDSIAVDNREGARRAVEHLLQLGHTRIAHISGPLAHRDARERYQGYLDALGRRFDPTLVVSGDFRMASGQTCMARLLESGRRFTAVFAASDQMAFAALLALRSHGLDVPGDVSVVGFDDEAFSGYCWPPLTTVRQPMFEIGLAAARHVIARTRGEIRPLPIFRTSLCVRRSTSAAPLPLRARIRERTAQLARRETRT